MFRQRMPETVSYTHLDVYKRQVLGSFRRWVAACGRQVTFPAPGKSPKDRRGAAQDDRFTLISALPRVLHYGDTLLFGHTLFPARKI